MNTVELLHDNRREKPTLHKNMEGPVILEYEVRLVLSKMDRNKVTDCNGEVLSLR